MALWSISRVPLAKGALGLGESIPFVLTLSDRVTVTSEPGEHFEERCKSSRYHWPSLLLPFRTLHYQSPPRPWSWLPPKPYSTTIIIIFCISPTALNYPNTRLILTFRYGRLHGRCPQGPRRRNPQAGDPLHRSARKAEADHRPLRVGTRQRYTTLLYFTGLRPTDVSEQA